ncbi:MAG: hypothetical protein CMJ83_18180 [Planctomycetes bacterium]|nr:hypothetical protein [Planctomycetota bacterium]
MMEEVTIEPGTARAFRLPEGTMLGIRDRDGHQACELLAVISDDPSEHLDPSVTMEIVGRLFPTEKSKFYTNRYQPIFTLVEDAVGQHDLMQPSTSKDSRGLFLGEDGSRVGTREWIKEAFATEGLTDLPTLHPVHLFRYTTVDAEGNFAMMATPSEAGTGVVLHCERPVTVVIAVSDDEISPVTGCNPTPILVEISGAV